MTEAATIIIAVTAILGCFAIISVILRCYCRFHQKTPLGADDYCMIIALILSTAISIVSDYAIATTGVGDPSYVPTVDAVVVALKANIMGENCQIAAMGFIKVSVLLYYKRIFVSRPFIMANNVLVVLVSSFTLAILLTVFFSKWPVYEQWNPIAPYNIDVSAVLITYVSGNAILDVITLALPITALQTLQMSYQRKLLLTIIFSLGSICIVASFIRLYYAVEFVKVPATPTSLFMPPFIYNSLWEIIECPLFIIAGSMLTLGPLFRSKYGPASIFRSVRGRLLSAIHTGSWKSSQGATNKASAALTNNTHEWTILADHNARSGVNSAEWELGKITTSDEAPTRRAAFGV